MWARIKDAQQQVEVTDLDPAGRYAPQIAAQFFACMDGVTTGSIFHGGDPMQSASWTIYTPPAPPPPAPPPPAIVNAGRFYVLFTPQQRIDIKAATDAEIKEFYETLQICISSGEPIDLGSSAVQQGLQYLAAVAVPGASPARNYITAGDMARITANQLP